MSTDRPDRYPCMAEACHRPASEQSFICDLHAQRMQTAFREIGDLLGDLDVTATKQGRTRPAGGKRGAAVHDDYVCPVCLEVHDGRPTTDNYITGEPHPSPVDFGAAELLVDVTNWLSTTAREVQGLLYPLLYEGPPCVTCIHLTCTRMRQQQTPRALVAACDWLARQVPSMRGLRQAEEWCDVTIAYRRDIVAAVDTRPEKVYYGACNPPDCTADLYSERSKATVTCEQCYIVHDLTERQKLLDELAMDTLLPLDELRKFALWKWGIKPSRQQMYAWRARNHLIAKGHRAVAGVIVDLYRVGDLVHLATRLAS